MVKTMFSSIFGSRNDKLIRAYQKRVNAINALESTFETLSDVELQERFSALKTRVQDNGESLESVLNESFAITREAAKRTLNMRHFDVQLIGAMALHDGRIAEMKTGEGENPCRHACKRA